ncbi:aminodeoxychorismate synthase component I [Maribacter sp. MAR_2009_72]|uniref:aminodeoxychorismate synthase component I n=1 Tax=Maribacter sp. MAR_2009_72 TaxID=1250050 RepID=UPI00119C5C86|nr:aminodeoxychorismate synthase component I [Maribacter sp. MAR_2009_72]TVZ15345.1 para-aminobenzoate synthetase component 1 [Maribacter sp. MAR_2009_72]
MNDFEKKVRHFLKNDQPFIFIIDFQKSEQLAYSFQEAAAQDIYFNIKGNGNDRQLQPLTTTATSIDLRPEPFNKDAYIKAFHTVQNELKNGNSFLLNLTFSTPLHTKASLKQIYQNASAPYKLWFKDKFIVFSPECYIKTKDDSIFSYPMKGTINNDVPDAEAQLLSNKKELYEHNTIVDLIRNDLSMIAKNVKVNKFRYVEKIKKGTQELLQTSTEIQGNLPKDWKDNFAALLLKTLPAGSISGAPKKKTIEIIEYAETTPRGFYTGVFGIFDGKDIDSAVSIRFIENNDGQLIYRSGGGITHLSTLEEEYQELLEKIYVPII